MARERKQKLGQITVRRRATKSTDEKRATSTQRKQARKNIY